MQSNNIKYKISVILDEMFNNHPWPKSIEIEYISNTFKITFNHSYGIQTRIVEINGLKPFDFIFYPKPINRINNNCYKNGKLMNNNEYFPFINEINNLINSVRVSDIIDIKIICDVKSGKIIPEFNSNNMKFVLNEGKFEKFKKLLEHQYYINTVYTIHANQYSGIINDLF